MSGRLLAGLLGLAALTVVAQFGPPGMGGAPQKLVKEFDKDGDGRLNAAERKEARGVLARLPRPQFRMPFGRPEGAPQETASGPKLEPGKVKRFGDEPLYDGKVLRTLFFEFEEQDWEKELADFRNSDVEVPAKLTVDGKAYEGVGVHFRGNSSYMMVPEGRKRSLGVSVDYTVKEQRLGGYRTLNLLNSHEDPTFLRSVLFLDVARTYVAAPKANFVRVVINGESWGVYVNAQQFNTDFVKEWFGESGGARWKAPGNPMARAGLAYLGDHPYGYKRIYEIKSKNDPKSWAALAQMTKVLNETPPDRLEASLEPLLDVDGALRFLALENALINNDGYWSRASDYNLYLDTKGKFHVIPHDANETFQPGMEMPRMGGGGPGRGGFMFGPGGPGGPPGFGPQGGPRAGGPPGGGPGPDGNMMRMPMPGPGMGNVKLDPFAGADDPDKALLHRLLAVPALRQRYLGYVRDIAAKWLDWAKLEPMVTAYQELIAADVKTDPRKLDSTEDFFQSVREETKAAGPGPMGGRPRMSLKQFVEQRRAFLLEYQETAKAAK